MLAQVTCSPNYQNSLLTRHEIPLSLSVWKLEMVAIWVLEGVVAGTCSWVGTWKVVLVRFTRKFLLSIVACLKEAYFPLFFRVFDFKAEENEV